ncbi:MAG: hypothetical protein CFH01_00864 [Alphaproteobacteria bacterium MarineAlpha2_Bin1]|nr:MAG: hypothetical protein CFH01_00864 [Alphaproteobacteria bacterium MarineAlpha2_Bin1]|tara:strand:+ start:1852 stop:2532 length:681 start_codon:yes stop_codon:yes gene_type:complete
MVIGTLNEGSLHSFLKDYYSSENSKVEVSVGKYVVDIISNGTIYEIQTGSFSGLSNKIQSLIEEYSLVLVYPIAACSIIAKQISKNNKKETILRKSPKKGDFLNIINELIYIPKLINHPRFSIEVVLIEERVNKIYDKNIRRNRGGWRTINRELLSIIDTKHIHSTQDLLDIISIDLPSSFDTTQLSIIMKKPLSFTQKLAYCLCKANVTKVIGKKGNSKIYSRNI